MSAGDLKPALFGLIEIPPNFLLNKKQLCAARGEVVYCYAMSKFHSGRRKTDVPWTSCDARALEFCKQNSFLQIFRKRFNKHGNKHII